MSSTLYTPDGRAREIRPSGATWSLEELQALVGGDHEVVSTLDERFMVINAQGKLRRLELNIPATRLYLHGRSDYIAGPALVVDTMLELDGPDD
jgi:uncharacterized protein DUF3846